MLTPKDIPMAASTNLIQGRDHQNSLDRCVYHGDTCIVVVDGERVCRKFGHVLGAEESAITYMNATNIKTDGPYSSEIGRLGTVPPKLRKHTRRVLKYGDNPEHIWQTRITNIAGHFELKRPICNEILRVYMLMRRKTAHRPTNIVFFAFYNTCRENGVHVFNTHQLREVICQYCKTKRLPSILKIYLKLGSDAHHLGIHTEHKNTRHNFKTYLQSITISMNLSPDARHDLEHRALIKYNQLPTSITERQRAKIAFISVIGPQFAAAIRRCPALDL